ncbi:MAG: hypothetical protein KatS3mg002_1647 [Candidatus Woesearchaeota archaeon]|nr:MAG: hypothetical protein KatS3mg002_1647 [Candidatus Woesearchaeota archaeon]
MISPLNEFVKAIKRADSENKKLDKIKKFSRYESYILLFIVLIFSIGLFINFRGFNLTGFFYI